MLSYTSTSADEAKALIRFTFGISSGGTLIWILIKPTKRLVQGESELGGESKTDLPFFLSTALRCFLFLNFFNFFFKFFLGHFLWNMIGRNLSSNNRMRSPCLHQRWSRCTSRDECSQKIPPLEQLVRHPLFKNLVSWTPNFGRFNWRNPIIVNSNSYTEERGLGVKTI